MKPERNFSKAIFSNQFEGCPILSHRVHWKMGHNDSFDLSNGEYLYSIGKEYRCCSRAP